MGIGEAIVKLLAAEGANLILLSRSEVGNNPLLNKLHGWKKLTWP